MNNLKSFTPYMFLCNPISLHTRIRIMMIINPKHQDFTIFTAVMAPSVMTFPLGVSVKPCLLVWNLTGSL